MGLVEVFELAEFFFRRFCPYNKRAKWSVLIVCFSLLCFA